MEHRNEALYDEIQAYTNEIRTAARLRSLKLVSKIIGAGIIAIAFLMTIFAYTSPSPAILAMDELTAHPSTMLIDASRKVLEKTPPGRLYVVKVLVEPL